MDLKTTLTTVLLAGVFSCHLLAQNPETIVVSGILKDIEEQPVSQEKITTRLEMITSGDTLFHFDTGLQTEKNGNFTFFVRELPAIFREDEAEGSANLVLTLIPADESDWMKEEKFQVSFTLEKSSPESYTMTRFEGQEMNQHHSDPVWSFSDIYPFGYLETMFIISFSDSLTDPAEMISIARQMMPEVHEEASPAPAQKRGIKGGYAVGGYQKK